MTEGPLEVLVGPSVISLAARLMSVFSCQQLYDVRFISMFQCNLVN